METLQHYALMTCAVVLGFSWLVFVHELGHYLLAKWNGVRVHVFSIGMGPYVFSFNRGDTLYVLSLVPIGGYVKMAGQDDLRPDMKATKDPQDYRNKKPGQRAAILAAGAAFNLIFAYLGFAACYYFGVEMPAPVIGRVSPKSQAGQAESYAGVGKERVSSPLQEGDRITMVNGRPIKSFFELAMAVGSAGSDRDIYIQYVRKNEHGKEKLSPTPAIVRTKRDQRAGAASVGIDKIMVPTTFPLGFEVEKSIYVGLVSEDSPAAKAGVKAGDRLVSLEDQPVNELHQVIELVNGAEGREMKFVVERDGSMVDLRAAPKMDKEEKRYLLGISMEIGHLVKEVDSSSVAYAKGLRAGELVRAKEYAKYENKIVLAKYDDPEAMFAKDHDLVRLPIPDSAPGGLSVVFDIPLDEELRAGSLGAAFGMAWADTLGHSTMVFIVLHRLITREVDFKNMAGPVGMAGILTQVASRRSFTYYLWFLALLSLNLGVLQFVPIPLLDGWHLVMIGVEKLKGSPVPLKIQEAFQYVGLFLILFLLIMVTKNDIMRFFN